MSLPRRVATATVALALVCAVGCDRPVQDDALHPQWRPVSLPMPVGALGRLMLRDATTCAGRWYVVGAVATAAGETRPAAWASVDAGTWTWLPVTAKTYYGERAILYSVGCRDGQVAVLGAKSGGAHGNPRVTTWTQRPDGSLVEVLAPFDLFGGPDAGSVSRIVAGRAGWLIAGSRVSGAAVWISADATNFRLVERVPHLASDARSVTSHMIVVERNGLRRRLAQRPVDDLPIDGGSEDRVRLRPKRHRGSFLDGARRRATASGAGSGLAAPDLQMVEESAAGLLAIR